MKISRVEISTQDIFAKKRIGKFLFMKIALGSAQFGSSYGIANSEGKVLLRQVSILVSKVRGKPGVHFGGLGSPGDPKGSPMRKRVDSGCYFPSIWVPILTHFWTKIIKKRLPDIAFCDL